MRQKCAKNGMQNNFVRVSRGWEIEIQSVFISHPFLSAISFHDKSGCANRENDRSVIFKISFYGLIRSKCVRSLRTRSEETRSSDWYGTTEPRIAKNRTTFLFSNVAYLRREAKLISISILRFFFFFSDPSFRFKATCHLKMSFSSQVQKCRCPNQSNRIFPDLNHSRTFFRCCSNVRYESMGHRLD